MVYNSLFNMLSGTFIRSAPDQTWDRWASRLSYDGNVRALLEELSSPPPPSPSEGLLDVFTAIANPWRLVCGSLDYKIDALSSEEALFFVQKTSECALSCYRKPASIPAFVSEYEKFLLEHYPAFLDTALSIQKGKPSWQAAHPALAQESAQTLIQKLGAENRDMLFISIGHGGVGPGMDLYHRVVGHSGSKGSLFYPVRFSTYKKGDTVPQVHASEKDYVREASQGRAVVLYEEETVTGYTLLKAMSFFSEVIGPTGNIISHTNNDPLGALRSLPREEANTFK